MLSAPRWVCRLLSVTVLVLACIFLLSFRWGAQIVWKQWHVQVYVGFVAVTTAIDGMAVRVPYAPHLPVLDAYPYPKPSWSYLRYAWRLHGFAAPHPRRLEMSMWIPLGMLGIVRMLLRAKTVLKDGQCPGCTYDLTGNVSGVCPECGRPIDGFKPPDVARVPPAGSTT